MLTQIKSNKLERNKIMHNREVHLLNGHIVDHEIKIKKKYKTNFITSQ